MSDSTINTLIGLASGAIGAILGAVATIFFQVRSERRARVGELRFQIYMLLLELKSAHFWITSAEFRRELADSSARLNFDRLRWRISDLLRQVDDLPELPSIIDVMHSVRFETEAKQSEEIDKVIDAMSNQLNPNYFKAISKVNDEGKALMTLDGPEWSRRFNKTQRGL